MSFLLEFVGHLIKQSMEDPVARREARNAHLRETSERAQALKDKWAQTIKAPQFWQSEEGAATVTWKLNPLLRKLPGRREVYPEQQ